MKNVQGGREEGRERAFFWADFGLDLLPCLEETIEWPVVSWFVSGVSTAAAAAADAGGDGGDGGGSSVCCHLLLMYVAHGSVYCCLAGASMVHSFMRDASDWIMSVICDISWALCYSQRPSCWGIPDQMRTIILYIVCISGVVLCEWNLTHQAYDHWNMQWCLFCTIICFRMLAVTDTY